MSKDQSNQTPEVNDETSVTVRLGNLVAVLGCLCVAAYAYAVLVNRVSVVERDLAVDQADRSEQRLQSSLAFGGVG